MRPSTRAETRGPPDMPHAGAVRKLGSSTGVGRHLRPAVRPPEPRRAQREPTMIAEAFLAGLCLSLPAVQRVWDDVCARTPEYAFFVAGTTLAQLFGYFLGAAPYALLDYARPHAALARKVQPGRFASRDDLARTVRSLFFLFFCVILPLVALGGLALPLAGITRDRPLPSARVLLVQLAFFLVVEDFLNYWLHRWLHTPWLYKKVHSVHHEFTAPFALMATHAHPAEVVILALPTFAGPALVAPHMFTLFVWQLLRNYEAIDIHSGYELPLSVKAVFPSYAGTEHHDYHHYMHSGNFASVFVWCDHLYGTDLGFQAYRERKLK